MSKPLQSGNLRHRIQLQRKSTAQDSFGQPVEQWNTYLSCWASIDVLRSAMLYQTAQFIAQSTYRIEIRYPHGFSVQPQDRIVCGNDVYTIETVTNPEQRNISLILLAYIVSEAS
jgi:SPP1 family predicted phage head-tail adaptor